MPSTVRLTLRYTTVGMHCRDRTNERDRGIMLLGCRVGVAGPLFRMIGQWAVTNNALSSYFSVSVCTISKRMHGHKYTMRVITNDYYVLLKIQYTAITRLFKKWVPSITIKGRLEEFYH